MGSVLSPVFLFILLCGTQGHESYDSLSAKQVEEEFSRLVEEAFRVNAEEDGLSSEPVQYKTAEMADAMLGSELHSNYRVPRLSVISEGNTDEYATESEEGTCDAMSEGLECQAPEGLLTLEKFYLEVQEEENAPILDVLPETEESNATESMKTPKVNCEERNITGISTFTLQILNVSQDLMEFLNPNSSECTLVLFYTPWCHFSAGLAPHFNCLPRAFPTIHFLALDASQHSSLSTRFGTVAVPNILLFQGAKPMARFNHTERTLETLKAFIFNQSGIEANKDVVITAEDQEGPLPSTPSKGIDWLLVFSLLFVGSFIMYATLRTESIWWLLPGPNQEHPE
ncbi:thioredoxin domain-containing protein 15 [Ambystoma mexicanum]|uniref:thioredoxin domain-containing protein 15 n=1 Tax=Ambystoma mexicanum TaxID=8296 RepID=UPI0037E79138